MKEEDKLITQNEKIIKEKEEQIEQYKKKLLDLEKQNQELNKIIEEKNNIIKEKEEFIKDNQIIITNKDNLEIIKNELTEKYGKLLNELNEQLNKIKRKLNKEKEETEKINSLIEDPKIKEKIKNDIENNLKSLEKREEIKLFFPQSFKNNQKEENFYHIMESIKKEYENKLKKEIESLTNQMKEMKEKIENEFNEKFEKKEKEYASKFNKIYNKYNEPEYSFECLNKKELQTKIYEGTDSAEFEIALKNNGDIVWDKNSQLIIVKPSALTANNINLKPQKPGDIILYKIIFRDLKRYPSGEYKSYLEFYSSGNNYGERLEIKINIM